MPLMGRWASCREPVPLNNFTFGNARFQYYETVAGRFRRGSRFRRRERGTDHMTNSRLTDPEVLEFGFRFAWSPLKFAQVPAAPAGGPAATAACGGSLLTPMTAVYPEQWPQGRGAFGMGRRRGGRSGTELHRANRRTEGTRFGRFGQRRWRLADVFVIITPGGGACGGRLELRVSGAVRERLCAIAYRHAHATLLACGPCK